MSAPSQSISSLSWEHPTTAGFVAENPPVRHIHVIHVTSSRFFGGPERQMLELARELAPEIRTTFVSFSEGGLCKSFLEEVRQAGFSGIALQHDTPRIFAAARELRRLLHSISRIHSLPPLQDGGAGVINPSSLLSHGGEGQNKTNPSSPLSPVGECHNKTHLSCSLSPLGGEGQNKTNPSCSLSPLGGEGQGEGVFLQHAPSSPILCVHGYKAGILGLWAARRYGIPVIAVSRGWTAESWKVRLYEKLDRLALRWMDKVVCVSEAQAERVRRAGVPKDIVCVIRNAVRLERFSQPPDPQHRTWLKSRFDSPPTVLIGAAGRLSPEKGFEVLIDACAGLRYAHPELDFGVVLFGDGGLRGELQHQIDRSGLASRFVLAGFTSELDRFMPQFDLFVQSSHTEGLPNVLLEAGVAGVPVVATAVGGTAEVVLHEKTGLLVPANDPQALAAGIERLCTDTRLRCTMQREAVSNITQGYTFQAQATKYRQLLSFLENRRTRYR